jgi:hypothetical protein
MSVREKNLERGKECCPSHCVYDPVATPTSRGSVTLLRAQEICLARLPSPDLSGLGYYQSSAGRAKGIAASLVDALTHPLTQVVLTSSRSSTLRLLRGLGGDKSRGRIHHPTRGCPRGDPGPLPVLTRWYKSPGRYRSRF